MLSGKDDDLLCEISQIPISGIRVAAEQIGYQAAGLMERLLRKRPVSAQPLLLAPDCVVTRQSTDTLAVQDARLVKAINFLRENVGRAVPVNEISPPSGHVAARLGTAIRQDAGPDAGAGNSTGAFERARQLLAKTDLPIPDVAEASGFDSPEYLGYVFRQEREISPSEYRRQEQGV